MIKIGSKWTSSDFRVFEVRCIEERSGEIWVSYIRHGSDRMYECLADAFLERFREHIN